METLEGINDIATVDDGLVTIAAKSGWFARRRSRVVAPVTWPADRTTISFARTDGSGQWRVTFAYEGQTAVVAVTPAALDAVAALAAEHLGGATNTVQDAEADRAQRRRLD